MNSNLVGISVTCDAFCDQASAAPTETPQEEAPEPAGDSDSEHFPEDETPEEEDEDDDDEEDEPYEEEYRVSPPRFFNTPVLDGFSSLFLMSHCCVFDKQSPPTKQTQENKEDDDDDEGTMPPYDPETQELIDGMCV